MQAVVCKHCGQRLGNVIENNPSQDQWNRELEKLPQQKGRRWGSSPQPDKESD